MITQREKSTTSDMFRTQYKFIRGEKEQGTERSGKHNMRTRYRMQSSRHWFTMELDISTPKVHGSCIVVFT